MKKSLFIIPMLPLTVLAGCGDNGGNKPDPAPHEHSYDPITGDCSCGAHEHQFHGNWQTNDFEHWLNATCKHTDIEKDRGEHTYGTDGKCTVCGKDGGLVTFVNGSEPYNPTNVSFQEHFSSTVGTSMTNYFEKIGNNILYKHDNGKEITYFKQIKENVYDEYLYQGDNWLRLGQVTSLSVYQHTALTTLWGFGVAGSQFRNLGAVRSNPVQTEKLNKVDCVLYTAVSGTIPFKYYVAEGIGNLKLNLIYKEVSGTDEASSTIYYNNFNESVTEFSMVVPQ